MQPFWLHRRPNFAYVQAPCTYRHGQPHIHTCTPKKQSALGTHIQWGCTGTAGLTDCLAAAAQPAEGLAPPCTAQAHALCFLETWSRGHKHDKRGAPGAAAFALSVIVMPCPPCTCPWLATQGTAGQERSTPVASATCVHGPICGLACDFRQAFCTSLVAPSCQETHRRLRRAASVHFAPPPPLCLMPGDLLLERGRLDIGRPPFVSFCGLFWGWGFASRSRGAAVYFLSPTAVFVGRVHAPLLHFALYVLQGPLLLDFSMAWVMASQVMQSTQHSCATVTHCATHAPTRHCTLLLSLIHINDTHHRADFAAAGTHPPARHCSMSFNMRAASYLL